MKTTQIQPQNFNLLAEILKPQETEDGIFIGAGQFSKIMPTFYLGTAVKLGDKANSAEQCPELVEGMGVIFSQIAGYQVPTTNSYCKLVRGHEVVALVTNMDDMNKETILPTKDRILVELIDESVIQDGIYDDTKNDPRDGVTQRGKVLKCAAGADQYPVGTILAFDPFCGNLIFNDGKIALKTVNSFDILFSLEG